MMSAGQRSEEMTRIKRLCVDFGISQAALAREMGVSRQHVNFWFTGRRVPSEQSLRRLDAALERMMWLWYPGRP